jgi:MFS family permease
MFFISYCNYPVGAPVSGWISDKIVASRRKARGGVWYPEDRLRGTLTGALFYVPLSMVFSGLFIKYVEGPVGLALVCVCFFMNGLGVSVLPHNASLY